MVTLVRTRDWHEPVRLKYLAVLYNFTVSGLNPHKVSDYDRICCDLTCPFCYWKIMLSQLLPTAIVLIPVQFFWNPDEHVHLKLNWIPASKFQEPEWKQSEAADPQAWTLPVLSQLKQLQIALNLPWRPLRGSGTVHATLEFITTLISRDERFLHRPSLQMD